MTLGIVAELTTAALVQKLDHTPMFCAMWTATDGDREWADDIKFGTGVYRKQGGQHSRRKQRCKRSDHGKVLRLKPSYLAGSPGGLGPRLL